MDTFQDFAKKCARYSTCQSCVEQEGCGYFENTGVCVPGSWLNPSRNYTDAGELWQYYHGQCYISTRIEFVLLPAILGTMILAAAIISIWRYATLKRFACGHDGHGYLEVGSDSDGECQHHSDEHTPLLIDNDPQSRAAGKRPSSKSSMLGPIETARKTQQAWTDRTPGNASFEEQYGSWAQRSTHMVQPPPGSGN
ncbi:hypothetical protein FBU59_006405 [Linderina macrospora]|uniref:Uncharacterized protein n=1 Tax=Linderina macrospora TaxID=4868 RepID=A0ACC1J010_9FUNG|nr:hypothetical protein FBU59_006405 [Linderina macrospora]